MNDLALQEYRTALHGLHKLQKSITEPMGTGTREFREKMIQYNGGTPIRKLGLDVHGVITNEAEFLSAKAAEQVAIGNESHIMSGSRYNQATVDQLRQYGFEKGVHYTHYFSITDHLIDSGAEVTFKSGLPHADAFLWDSAKGEYALTQGLHCLWDDSPVYGRYMPPCCWYFNFHKDTFDTQLDQVLKGTRPKVGRK